MEKLKNENLKKIEIKIQGDNCIISYPSSKKPSKKDVSTFPPLDNDNKSFIDLNLSISSNSEEDFISNLKEIRRKNKDNESNSKQKLEITNKSIFYSESNIKFSPSDAKNIKDKKINDINNKECLLKNSVIKKLNFDKCGVIKDIDKNKVLSGSDRNKNKKNLLYKNKQLLEIFNINNILINNRCNKGAINAKKRTNSMINYEIKMQKKKDTINKVNLNINQSFIRHRQNNSFVLPNPFNTNRVIYLNNLNNKNSAQYSPNIKGNITLRNHKSKGEIKFHKNNKKKYKSPKLFNKNRNIKNNFDKMTEEKSLIKSNCLKFKSTGDFSQSKKENKSQKLIENKSKMSKEKKIISNKNNKKIIQNKIDNKKLKILNKNNPNIKKTINMNINKKNMFCIKKPNKKIVSYLTSNLTNNTNNKIEKNSKNNYKNEYCSLKQYYHFKSPYLLNIQGTSYTPTPIVSTNGCTNCSNGSNCSTLNSPSTTTTKIFCKSNLEEKNNLIKYYSQNSFLKNMIYNTYNYNDSNENKNVNINQYHQNQKCKNKNYIDENKNQINKNKSNNILKNPENNKSLKTSKIKEINKKLLNKCNTKELQKVIKSNDKSLHKILTERNLSGASCNSSFNKNNYIYLESNPHLSNNNDIKEIKKMLLRNKFDKRFINNIDNKNSL